MRCSVEGLSVHSVNLRTHFHLNLLLFSSFKPRGGSIEKVTVYPNDFGLERLAREEVEGPSELVHCGSGEEEEGEGSPGEGDGHSVEKLRSYQLNRLR